MGARSPGLQHRPTWGAGAALPWTQLWGFSHVRRGEQPPVGNWSNELTYTRHVAWSTAMRED